MSEDAQQIHMIAVDSIKVLNPRVRNKRIFQELVTSIAHLGLKKPITVSLRGDGSGYDLVCGQGRAAAREAHRAGAAGTVPGGMGGAAADVSGRWPRCLRQTLIQALSRRKRAPDFCQIVYFSSCCSIRGAVLAFFERRSFPMIGERHVCPIPLRDGGVAYMRLDGELSADRAVVVCDPAQFLRMWKLSGRRPDVLACESDWTRDYKFAEAIRGFSHGADNPVPLARVTFRWEISQAKFLTSRFGRWRNGFEARPFLDFGNGITRTIWLLHSGAHFFPVECSKAEARAFHTAVGIGPSYLTQEDFRWD